MSVFSAASPTVCTQLTVSIANPPPASAAPPPRRFPPPPRVYPAFFFLFSLFLPIRLEILFPFPGWPLDYTANLRSSLRESLTVEVRQQTEKGKRSEEDGGKLREGGKKGRRRKKEGRERKEKGKGRKEVVRLTR